MAERCGSYPLMNLAEDFGVDYGDVLLAADLMGYAQLPPNRFQQGGDAMCRIADSIGHQRAHDLVEAMSRVVPRRWWPD